MLCTLYGLVIGVLNAFLEVVSDDLVITLGCFKCQSFRLRLHNDCTVTPDDQYVYFTSRSAFGLQNSDIRVDVFCTKYKTEPLRNESLGKITPVFCQRR